MKILKISGGKIEKKLMKAITFLVIQFIVSAKSQWINNCVGQMDGIVFPDSENCDAFIQCQRGVAVPQRCQPGTSFDLSLYYCVPSHTTDCGTRRQLNPPVLPPRMDDSPPTSDEHHRVCRNTRNGLLIPNPQNCRAYIECQNGFRLDRECKPGELFEANSAVCLSNFAVDCGSRKPPRTNDDVMIRNVCGNQRNGVRVADPRDCRRYFVCSNRQGTEEECRTGELFEINLQRCVNAGAVSCNGRPNGRDNVNQPPVNSNGIISATICNGMPTGTRISDPSNCQRYFECRNNQRFEIRCNSNQAFDSVSNQCRPASTVNCGNSGNSVNSNNSGITGRNPQTNSICTGQPNGRRLPNQTNCRAFIECQGNAQADRTCNIGSLFDAQIETCLPANMVRCGSRRIPPSENDLESPENFFPPCPPTGVVFRTHPHDCQGYFICAEGNLIQHSCGAGIYFNPDTLQCDLPQNVQCRLTRIVVPQTPLLPDCSSGANYFPNLVNCKQYYKCVNSLPQLMDCPKGSLWNNHLLKCEKSESDICARRFDDFKGDFVYSKPNDKEKA